MHYAMHASVLIAAVISCVMSPTCAGEATDRAEQEKAVYFDPTMGSVIGSSGKWVAWTRKTVDPKTLKMRALGYSFVYFIQQLDSPSPPTQVFESRGWGSNSAAILADQTLLLSSGALLWIPSPNMPWTGGKDRVPRRSAWIASIGAGGGREQDAKHYDYDADDGSFTPWADGVISVEAAVDRQSARPRTSHSFSWIPIRDHHLDTAAKVLLEDGIDKDVEGLAPIRFARHGNEIVWVDATRSTQRTPEKLRRPPELYIFDVGKKNVRKVIPTGADLGASKITSFDGQAAFDGCHAIDVLTGATKSVTYMPDSVLLHGIAYSVKETPAAFALVATRLDDAAHGDTVHTLEKAKIGLAVDNGAQVWNGVFLLMDDGIRGFDGRTWTPIPLEKGK
jgi:hypothetical protein